MAIETKPIWNMPASDHTYWHMAVRLALSEHFPTEIRFWYSPDGRNIIDAIPGTDCMELLKDEESIQSFGAVNIIAHKLLYR